MTQTSARTRHLPVAPAAIVFDLDGTLIDSEAVVADSFLKAAPVFGVTLTDAHFHSFVGKQRSVTDDLLRSYFGPDFPVDAFREEVSRQFGDRTAPLKPGVTGLLDHLDAVGLRYALATSSYGPWVDRHFSAYGLQSRFAARVTRDDVTNAKPHPEPYLRAAMALGHAAPTLLAIEDSPTGVEAAHASGMITLMVPDMVAPTDACRGRAHLILDSLHDVLELLRSHQG